MSCCDNLESREVEALSAFERRIALCPAVAWLYLVRLADITASLVFCLLLVIRFISFLGSRLSFFTAPIPLLTWSSRSLLPGMLVSGGLANGRGGGGRDGAGGGDGVLPGGCSSKNALKSAASLL
jgi:hypothetical protein